MRIFTFLIFLFFSLVTTAIFGQTPEDDVVRYETIPFSEYGFTLPVPYAGGMNSPLYSEADLNNDGITDIFYFDRVDNSATIILRNGPNQYQSGFYLQKNIPPLLGYALLLDYNCDGITDLFTSSRVNGSVGDGITVYTGSFNGNNEIEFSLTVNELMHDNNQELYSFIDNVPSIVDIDSDGDMDILTFKSIAGKQIAYYKNNSMELFNSCDELEFELVTDCYGSFTDDGTIPLTLDTDCGNFDNPSIDNRHGVSSLLSFDNDNDGLYELMIGNEFYNTVSVLFNNGTPANTNFHDQDNAFPSNAISIEIASLPTPSMIDADLDGVMDLLIANRSTASSENYATTKIYQRNENNDFDLVSDTFLVKNMLDMGEFASPVFYDFDQDGLIDILVGNSGYFNPVSGLAGTLTAYKNIGNAQNPSFQLVDRDFQNISIYDWNFISPSFGDLDGDGDDDMIIGEGSGKIHYFENTAGPGNPIDFGIAIPGYADIDIGKNATPQIVDVNRDGKLDLMLGTKAGFLVYYPNNGTTDTPVFDEQILQVGEVDTRVFGQTVGYSAPILSEIETPGSYLLYAASESGTIFRYNDLENNLNPGDAFSQIDSSFADIKVGARTRIDLADIDGDGDPEMIVGNSRGGLAFYNFGPITNTIDPFIDENFSIYPNPTHSSFLITGSQINDVLDVDVFSIDGKKVNTSLINGVNQIRIGNLDSLPTGLYFVKITLNNIIVTKKITISKS